MIQELISWCKANANCATYYENQICICVGIFADKFRCLNEFKNLQAYKNLVEFKQMENGTYCIGIIK